ncbi:hypothetical protein M2396_002013 [Pseudomonas sp. BIGb0278]|uniref:DUF6543 domain-containing protein n=1 Tax=Pseudomonas sp. BIGb0278 TaxID=2940607 RepID=UPI0021696A05|nr:DUF6543 domain-containing protein [Pseudomonas sp. BIGb0278]MCS4283720.1 hypothetical protein [Pseudomonas sp. BIGb0278]
MPLAAPTPIASIQRLVAARFANRPSLRQVIAHEGLETLARRYPWIRTSYPQLESLEGFSIIHAQAPGAGPGQSPLVDTLIAHLLSGKRMALAPTDQLSLATGQVFHPQQAGPGQPEIDLRMADLNQDFDALLACVIDSFQQAQIGFWNAREGDSEISALRWMQQLLKANLLANIQRQGLGDAEKSVLYGLLEGRSDGLVCHALQVRLNSAGVEHCLSLSSTLLCARHADRDLLLWCKPTGTVHGYHDLSALACALRDELAQRYHFESMVWAKAPLEEDTFAHQARQLLNGILDEIGRLRLADIATPRELEAALSLLSDPAAGFLDQPWPPAAQPNIEVPGWLAQASAGDRFQYQTAMLQLAASQALAKGETSWGDIEDLNQYASRCLREQMHADHPQGRLLQPDQVLASIAQRVQTSSLTFDLQYLRTESLTALAITRLQVGEHEAVTGILLADGSQPPQWLTPEYVDRLIRTVDIGGRYPGYVNAALQDARNTAHRVRLHAREWRSHLLLGALQAKIAGQLRDRSWQALADFCDRPGDRSSVHAMAPLAFLCAPQAAAANEVQGMFLIRLQANGPWVLYRALCNEQVVREFDDLEQLMDSVLADQPLQQDMLDWMDDDARAIYEDGGFQRPHLHRNLSELAHLLAPADMLDALLSRLRQPARVRFSAWQGDLDQHMFQARGKALLVLASRQSVSNAQQRWALISQLAWLAFNTVASVLRGPAASVAWLIISLAALKDDLAALERGTPEEKALAVTDVLTNLAMLLVHGHASGAQPDTLSTPLKPRLEGPRPHEPGATLNREEPSPAPWQEPVEQGRPAPLRVSGWQGRQGLGHLTAAQRETLAGLRARISLAGHSAQPHGRLRGLFKVNERHYVVLDHEPYEVQETFAGVRIVGPEQNQSEWSGQWGGAPDGYYLPDRERAQGPWITRWNGEWRLDLRLAGGMPKSRRQAVAEKVDHFNALQQRRRNNDSELTKLAPLAERNAQLLSAYDQEAAAFRSDMEKLPPDARAALPDDLRIRLENLHGQRKQHRPILGIMASIFEKQSVLIESNIALFTELGEPQYQRMDPEARARRALNQWYEQSINNDQYLYHRLLELTDYDSLSQQSRELARLPVEPAEIELATTFRRTVAEALTTHQRMLTVSERLDANIRMIYADHRIQFENQQEKMSKAVAYRTYSTLMVRGQIFSDLAQLVIDRTRLEPESFEAVLRLQAGLRSSDFHQAMLSHDSLEGTALEPAERVEVLGNALREYRASLGKAHELLSLDEPAVDKPRVEDYIRELSQLEALTVEQLSNTLRDNDSGATPPVVPMTHRERPGNRRLIRTARGKPLLAEQNDQGTLAVQHDPLTDQAVSHYEQRDGQWAEAAKAAPTPPGNAYLRRVGSSLLARKDARLALAARYLNEPNSLADLLDWHIQDMDGIATQLEAGQEQALATQLREAIGQMQSEKRRLLTQAYLDTRHPDSQALHFLVAQGEVQIQRVPTTLRKRLKDKDYLDVYAINRTMPHQQLWEAHFHYSSAQAAPRAFAKGHLKFWEPRAMSREEQLQRTVNPAERVRIYRGDLRLEQIEDLFPFSAP